MIFQVGMLKSCIRRILTYMLNISMPTRYKKYNAIAGIKIVESPEADSETIKLNSMFCWFDNSKYVDAENNKNINNVCAVCIVINDVVSILILGAFFTEKYIPVRMLIIININNGFIGNACVSLKNS